MKTEILMIILTMLDGGQMSSAFVNTPSMTNCEQRAKIVGAILKKGKEDVRTIKCVPSDLKFIKFEHKTAAKAERYLFSVELGENKTIITPLNDLSACKKQQANAKPASKTKLYCTSSTQKLKTK